jgi:hypothetical protein
VQLDLQVLLLVCRSVGLLKHSVGLLYFWSKKLV